MESILTPVVDLLHFEDPRSGEALTEKERPIHKVATCGVLRYLHDEVDRIVADAYGWPWAMETDEILARLVALYGVRVEEEKWQARGGAASRFTEASGSCTLTEDLTV